ncbi:hypothetical protein [Bacillus pumilus]|uniref:hypothetical protein n=1 Tax=Bacillus pumilus TaxID=1408 RepID=UPI003305CB68
MYTRISSHVKSANDNRLDANYNYYAMTTELAEHSKGLVFWAALADPAGSMPAF